MSFSFDLKTELSAAVDAARHCRIAELAALIWFLAEKNTNEEIVLIASSRLPLEAAKDLLKKLFGVRVEPVFAKTAAGNRRYSLELSDEDKCGEIRRTLKYSEGDFLSELKLITARQCCRRAFLRGAFLSAGTISDPERAYHAEINCKREEQAAFLQELLLSLHIPAKILKRSRYDSVYIKDSEQISDMLGLMGARVSLLELENKRILHSMRGSVNRKVNCETANINKTAEASARQIEDIQYIFAHSDGKALSGRLDEVARLRLEYPEATLQELGEMMDPPVGKSGINHRLRKLGRIASDLRNEGSLRS